MHSSGPSAIQKHKTPARQAQIAMPPTISNKRLIIKSCREVLLSSEAEVKDKVRAASTLTQMLKLVKKLAPEGPKRRKIESQIPTDEPEHSERLSSLLESTCTD